MTALFHDIIFGPVHSRRLGLSLGVNLLPLSSKLCSFDCIYCECGWNVEHPGGRRFNSREDVRTQLEATLRRMVADSTPPDVITFAGNGEPTMHPDFEAVIGDTIALRDALCPAAKVSVLSNATQIHRDSVRRALLRVDNNILKLDSAFDATVRRMNNPQSASYSVRGIVEAMKRFDGRMILQTMFLRGECGGQPVDNTTEEEVSAWLRLVAEIRPRQVMVYSLELAAGLATLPTDELARLLRVNRRIAAENRLRYGRFHGDDDAAIPALTAYTGIVFKRIDPASFTDADFEYAQRHLNITSFLYGLLRPLDAIRTYRLEGDAVLPGRGDETMFSYWQSRLTDDLLGRIHADDGILVNLASGEMKRLFDWKRVCREARVITPEFRVREGDRLKTVVVYTKMCRGEMTRHILKNRIADPATLRSFEWEGFRLDPALSKGDDWVFTL